ncbi:L-rhamnose mutarotase [Sphingomonas jinjuensis]|uniref:L-rhamnose mutarotase n=1 Tax=Sphingomonas jinjuensis TaxID=535907 RepID=A0A840FKS5_9SPHN|nr:L-rhamnose mutarotase [Sphingomonas jinjuensis]MBB4153925.1 L-rhamnose mutarotase [Sphingomonas jinjuensis]
MPRHVLTLDLKDDPALIAAYDEHHRAVWPEIEASILASGIHTMTIHRLGTRLVMILDVAHGFSFARKAAADAADPVVQRWEALMARFQDVAHDGAKWREMEEIYRLGGI